MSRTRKGKYGKPFEPPEMSCGHPWSEPCGGTFTDGPHRWHIPSITDSATGVLYPMKKRRK